MTKACNQMIVGMTIQAVAEAFTLAKKAGVDLEKKTGIPKKKLLPKKVMGALLMPVTFKVDRTILSAAPLSNIHFPIIEAMAIRIPICPTVVPNRLATLSPMELLANLLADAGSIPVPKAYCSIEMAGVIQATTRAAINRERKG
jgi:hypothetical protein